MRYAWRNRHRFFWGVGYCDGEVFRIWWCGFFTVAYDKDFAERRKWPWTINWNID